jgi:hypothetical protein
MAEAKMDDEVQSLRRGGKDEGEEKEEEEKSMTFK